MQNPLVRSIYLKEIEKAEHFAKIIWRANFLSIQCIVFPNILLSIYNYYVSNYSEDSFILPAPAMYLFHFF